MIEDGRLAVEEEAARATHPHAVEVEVEEFDDGSSSATVVRFTCSAPAGSLCRSWCVECEEECSATPILREVEQVAQAPLDGHRYEPVPYCRVVEWLGAGDAGDREELHADDEPLRPGARPIEEEWDGDGYLWRYAVPEPEPLHPGHP